MIEALAESESMDIDKAWHVLHFLFTGFAWDGGFPAGFLVSCGETVGDVDVGYGPARSFTPAEVKKIAEFPASLNGAVLRGRFKPATMNQMEIYQGPWEVQDPHADEKWDYFEGYFNNTARLVAEAAERNLALLVYIN